MSYSAHLNNKKTEGKRIIFAQLENKHTHREFEDHRRLIDLNDRPWRIGTSLKSLALCRFDS